MQKNWIASKFRKKSDENVKNPMKHGVLVKNPITLDTDETDNFI